MCVFGLHLYCIPLNYKENILLKSLLNKFLLVVIIDSLFDLPWSFNWFKNEIFPKIKVLKKIGNNKENYVKINSF